VYFGQLLVTGTHGVLLAFRKLETETLPPRSGYDEGSRLAPRRRAELYRRRTQGISARPDRVRKNAFALLQRSVVRTYFSNLGTTARYRSAGA